MGKILKNFIVFEGLDGSGQTTQATLLTQELQRRGQKVLLTKEPTNNLVGGLIRGALTKEWRPSNLVIQLLYAADRGHHLEREILPALKKGYTVICDRYIFSSLAFGSLDIDYQFLRGINANFPLPEKVFYIDVAAETSIKRITQGRFEFELFEQKEKLAKIARAYKKIFTDYPMVTRVNGQREIDAIHQEILKHF